MSQLNINFGIIPNLQTVDRNQSFLHRMITSLIENDNILNRTNNNPGNQENHDNQETIIKQSVENQRKSIKSIK